MVPAIRRYRFPAVSNCEGRLELRLPFVLMAGRYIVVGIIFCFIGGRKIPTDRDAQKVALYASVSTLLWAVGLQYVSPGDSAVLSYTMSLFSIPIAYFSINEKVSPREVFGAILGFSGVIIYSITLSHDSVLFGAIITILNAVFWAAYSVYYRKLKDREPAPILRTQFLLVSIPFIIGSIIFPKVNPTVNFFIDFGYIIFFMGLVQYFLWNKLLRLGRVDENYNDGVCGPGYINFHRRPHYINSTQSAFDNLARE
jgi:drug/metabolite transporter (DMT)-like permease